MIEKMYCYVFGALFFHLAVAAQNPAGSFYIPCNLNENCPIEGSYCSDQQCMCFGGKLCDANDVLKKGVFRKLDSTQRMISCQKDADCPGKNNKCNTQKSQCKCTPGFVLSGDGSKCLEAPKQKINGTCTDSNQCKYVLDFTTCNNSRCECAQNYHFADEKCTFNQKIFGTCSGDGDCVNGAVCTRGHCQCSNDKVYNGKECLPKPKTLGDKCIDEHLCIEAVRYSTCKNEVCVCPESHAFDQKGNACEKIIDTLGEPCKFENQCYKADPENNRSVLRCSENSICECNSGYLKIQNETMKTAICESGSSRHGLYILVPILTSFLVFAVL